MPQIPDDEAPRARAPRARAWGLLRLGWASGGRAVGVLDVWIWWERLLARRQHIQPVRPDGVFRYSLARHHAERVVLGDGTAIEKGDPIVELHLDNRRLVELSEARTTPWALLRLLRGDLAALQRSVAGGRLGGVAALHGVTLFAGAGPPLGFEVRPLSRSWYWALQRFFMAGLVMLYHPAGWRAVQRQVDRWPREVWMSRSALEARYGGPEPRRPAAT